MISNPLPIATSHAPMYMVLSTPALALISRSRVNGEYNPNAKHKNMLNWKKVIGFMKKPGRTSTSITTKLSPMIWPAGVSVAPRSIEMAAIPNVIDRIEKMFAFT